MTSASRALFRSTAADAHGRPACASTGSAAEFLPPRLTLPQLSEAAKDCHGCDLYCGATQTVFGEGPAHALAMFVGE